MDDGLQIHPRACGSFFCLQDGLFLSINSDWLQVFQNKDGGATRLIPKHPSL
ncbi:MAG: hypothetical protein R2941_20035 [Desulfobacterales bacterium]